LRKERNKRQETGLETPDKAQKTLKYKDFKIHRVDIAPQVKVSGSNPPLENYKLGGKKKYGSLEFRMDRGFVRYCLSI